jgi:hypothetical protein
MKTKYLLFILLFFIAFEKTYGSCGSSSCPLYVFNPLSRGYFSLGLSYEYIYQNQIYVGSDKSFVGAIPEHHDEVSTLNQITALTLGYTAFDFLRLDFALPFIHREHSHIHNHEGEQLWEYWNFTGVGDAIITGNFSILSIGDDLLNLNLNAGVKLPTGITDVKNNEGEEAEVTIQPGTGSTDLIFGTVFSKNLASLQTLSGEQYSSFPVVLSVNYRLNGKGTDDYKFGNELLLHLSTAYRFVEKISLLLQVNARFMEHSDVGTTGEPEENTGGKWIFLSPGLKFYLSDDISLYSYLQLPVYQNVNGIQQTAKYNLKFGINKELNILD